MARAWFVTAACDAATPLDGPFASYDECARRCVARTDRMTVLAAFVAHRMPGYYVPHQFEVRYSEVLHYKGPESAPPPTAPAPRVAPSPTLPDVVYTYTRTDLLALCKGLEIRPPPSSADKAAIITHIEKQLRTLARGVARDGPA